jgi:MazG family protein
MTGPKLKKNPRSKGIGKKFSKLVDVMYTLRSKDGCPWDRAQSLKDLKQYLLEETYELLEALDREEVNGILEELGDLLFQVVFLGQIMQEKKSFSLLEVEGRLLDKMIGRHPHVFAGARANSPQHALAQWEAMKIRGTPGVEARPSLLQGVPRNLPALHQAHLISSKVARVGFDWNSEGEVWKKFREEIREFRDASSKRKKEEEMGDMLFTLVNIARKNQIHPEDALRAANEKFRDRFNRLEKRVRSRKKELRDLSLKEMDQIWDEIKTRKSRKT